VHDEQSVSNEEFDLILLCDVIEHVPDDRGLMSSVVSRHLAANGRLIVTVPAFQALFSAHDLALKHYRRYNLSELELAVREAGLELLASGYLFGSLLPARALTRLVEAVRPPPPAEEIGLSRWKGGRFASSVISSLLSADNSALLALAERGIKAPGLSAWACCRAATVPRS
jgi:hypothetical protein